MRLTCKFCRFVLLVSTLSLFLSCTTVTLDRSTGTRRPKFASLEIEGVFYELNSQGVFKDGEDLQLDLKMKNISQKVKTFKLPKNRFLILNIKDEAREILHSYKIMGDKFFNTDSFSLNPGTEKDFKIVVPTKGIQLGNNTVLFCQLRLHFLPKMFRRNSLSVYIEKD